MGGTIRGAQPLRIKDLSQALLHAIMRAVSSEAGKFFVAGATGFTGREVVRLARERGFAVIAHIRPESSSRQRWTQAFEQQGATVDVSPWEPDAIAEAVRRHTPTHVFGLLGITQAGARREAKRGAKPSYETVDRGLTELLIDASNTIRPAPRFVYLSSLGVGKDEPSNAYLAARWHVERRLREGPLPFTVARPSFITGPDRDELRVGERVGATVANGALAIAGLLGARRMRDQYRSISNTELAEALLRLALDPAAEGAIVEARDLR